MACQQLSAIRVSRFPFARMCPWCKKNLKIQFCSVRVSSFFSLHSHKNVDIDCSNTCLRRFPMYSSHIQPLLYRWSGNEWVYHSIQNWEPGVLQLSTKLCHQHLRTNRPELRRAKFQTFFPWVVLQPMKRHHSPLDPERSIQELNNLFARGKMHLEVFWNYKGLHGQRQCFDLLNTPSCSWMAAGLHLLAISFQSH